MVRLLLQMHAISHVTLSQVEALPARGVHEQHAGLAGTLPCHLVCHVTLMRHLLIRCRRLIHRHHTTEHNLRRRVHTSQLLNDLSLVSVHVLARLRLILVNVNVIAGGVQVNHAGVTARQSPTATHHPLIVGGAHTLAGGHKTDAAATEQVRDETCLLQTQTNPGGCGHLRVTNHQGILSAKNIGVTRQTVRLIPVEFSLLKLGVQNALLGSPAHRQTLPTGKVAVPALLPPVLVDTGFHRNRTVLGGVHDHATLELLNQHVGGISGGGERRLNLTGCLCALLAEGVLRGAFHLLSRGGRFRSRLGGRRLTGAFLGRLGRLGARSSGSGGATGRGEASCGVHAKGTGGNHSKDCAGQRNSRDRRLDRRHAQQYTIGATPGRELLRDIQMKITKNMHRSDKN